MTGRKVAQAALVVAGLLAIWWALTWGANPQITCRGVPMGPGDVCAHAGDRPGTQKVQTYQERLGAAQAARPVVAVTGGLVALFGIVLLRSRHAEDAPTTSPGEQ